MSRSFNGTSDLITPTFPRNTSQISICYTYKRNSASGRHFIVWAGAVGAGNSNYYLYQSATVCCLGWYNGSYREQTFSHTADTALHRICWVADWDADTIAGYIDGAGQSISLSGHTTTPSSATGADRFGVLSDTGIDWANGELSEVGVWTGLALSADEAIALTKGYAPLAVRRQNLAAYWPLYGNLSNEPDIVGGTTCSLTGTSKAAHPPVIYPRRRHYFFAPDVGAEVSYEQEGFRWRYDDGDEDGATFSAAQDEPSAASIGITKRLRVLVDVTGNPGSPAAEQFQLQYRRTGSPTEEWKKVN